jgi:hypothetical protein
MKATRSSFNSCSQLLIFNFPCCLLLCIRYCYHVATTPRIVCTIKETRCLSGTPLNSKTSLIANIQYQNSEGCKSLGFWSLEFGPVCPLSNMSLRMVLTSMRSVLRRRVFGSIPFVTTQIEYLGRRGFKLILQCPKLIPLVLPWFSIRFAFRHRESQSWLATKIVRPITYVSQVNC